MMTDLERAQKVQAAELLLKLTNYIFQTEYRAGNIIISDSDGFRIRLIAFGKIAAKVNELRDNRNCEVYAVTHEMTSFGECFSFLIVPACREDWDKLLRPGTDGTTLVYAYVWNLTHEECSESGYIAVKFENGILRRVG